MEIAQNHQWVLDFIHSLDNQGCTCTQVAEKRHISLPAARRLLQDLTIMKRIRMTRNGKGNALYLIETTPSNTALPAQLPPFKPLTGYAVEMRRIAASAVAGR